MCDFFTVFIPRWCVFDKFYAGCILKSADSDGSACNRYTFSYSPVNGVGHFIHTYNCDGNPIPTFTGEPERVEVPNDIDEFTANIWENLNEANKISIYVRYINLKDGSVENIVIGEDDSDPVFYIDDLLPHLAANQMSKPAKDVIAGEQLNILSGSRPFEKELPEGVKLNIMKILNDKYGMTEADFISAEISAVPTFKARDIGFDRSLIGSYGHDDRVCAYPSLTALMEVKDPKHTIMAILADKEEVGSDGNTGMQSNMYYDIITDLANTFGVSDIVVRANSKCLSSDVNAAFDPNFPEVSEKRNSCFVNNGVVITKYTGAKGKSGTNDASAEFAGYIRNLLDAKGVIWQTSELGKIDQGGGGTVAKYIAKYNIDVIDLGVPVISMHAPYEVVSKTDVYMVHKALVAFFGE